MRLVKDVDEYISSVPSEARPKLNEMRGAIREAAPDSVETISYGMPFYTFKGESGFQARLCYFGLLEKSRKVVFYIRPVYLEDHIAEAKAYMSTKSALQFPLDKAIPVRLVKKLVRTGVAKHRAGDKSSHGKSQ